MAVGTNTPTALLHSDNHESVGFFGINLKALATTTVKTGAGFLFAITINTKGASANTATVYDNTAGSGTLLATIDTTGGTTTLNYGGIKFSTGLTIVLAAGTSADITVTYI